LCILNFFNVFYQKAKGSNYIRMKYFIFLLFYFWVKLSDPLTRSASRFHGHRFPLPKNQNFKRKMLYITDYFEIRKVILFSLNHQFKTKYPCSSNRLFAQNSTEQHLNTENSRRFHFFDPEWLIQRKKKHRNNLTSN